MSTFWKVMLGLLLTLPVGAYVTGALVTSQSQLPRERPAIVISDPPQSPTAEKPEPTRPTAPNPEKAADAEPTSRPEQRRPREDDPSEDRGRNGARGDDTGGADDDNEVRVVRPAPAPVDDDDDSDGDDDAGDDSDDGGGDD